MHFRINYDEQMQVIRRMADTTRSPIPGSHQTGCAKWQDRRSSGQRGGPVAC